MAFTSAAIGAVRQAFDKGNALLLQPIMTVEVNVPDEYLVRRRGGAGFSFVDLTVSGPFSSKGAVIGGINKRKGTVLDSEAKDGYTTINCEVGLGCVGERMTP